MTEQDPKTLKVVVTNTLNGVTGELFNREMAIEKRDSGMKALRQKIRDLGLKVNDEKVTIRQATVTDVQEGDVLTKTIAFSEAVVTNEKTVVTGRTVSSSARKKAEDTTENETDVEILGIANDDTLAKNDAKEALMKYPRHHLIHAVNISRDEGAEKMHHFSTKVQAVDALLSNSDDGTEE